MTDEQVVQAICEHEQQRCAALVAKDILTLQNLIGTDLVHIHATGRIDDYQSYMEGVTTRLDFLSADRRSLAVRPYGHFAVATGELSQMVRIMSSGELRDLQIATSQVWVWREGGWRQISFQATLLPTAE